MALPLPIISALLLVHLGAMAYGFVAPPGHRARPVLTVLFLGLGMTAFPLGLGAVVIGRPQLGTVLVWGGVLCFTAAARLLRVPPPPRRDDEGGDDDGGGGGDPPGDPATRPGGPGLDWDAFDRERSGWERDRPLTPAG
jgi:hypothetical protein